ncbi:MAG: YcxB family protein [Pseudomonadota bacterium]
MFEFVDGHRIAGRYTKTDLKRLTSETRTGSVGPTTVYYAGATAPIISASVSLLARHVFQDAGLTPYWVLLLSALIAATAGITWYLIFMRMSYRQTHGRGDEADAETELRFDQQAIWMSRGAVEMRIGWDAVAEVRAGRKFLALMIDGSDTLLIPDSWFGKDKSRRNALHDFVRARAEQTKATERHGQTAAPSKSG